MTHWDTSMSVSTIGVIGAGVMGSGIAQVAATKGINVTLLDVNERAVKAGIDVVESRLGRVVSKGKMTPAEKEAAVGRIKGMTTYDALKPAEVIIEAATEDYDLKTRIFKQVDALVSAEPIVASNTSSVSITKLASSRSHPQRFVGAVRQNAHHRQKRGGTSRTDRWWLADRLIGPRKNPTTEWRHPVLARRTGGEIARFAAWHLDRAASGIQSFSSGRLRPDWSASRRNASV
jgi:3-hydroxyacyl-CoA dehydrogenase, NAD binding domain